MGMWQGFFQLSQKKADQRMLTHGFIRYTIKPYIDDNHITYNPLASNSQKIERLYRKKSEAYSESHLRCHRVLRNKDRRIGCSRKDRGLLCKTEWFISKMYDIYVHRSSIV
jgi:hypothetical protein